MIRFKKQPVYTSLYLNLVKHQVFNALLKVMSLDMRVLLNFNIEMLFKEYFKEGYMENVPVRCNHKTEAILFCYLLIKAS